MTTETNFATQDPMSNGIKQAFAPLTDAFKNSPPPKIKNLECYDATEKK